MGQRNTVVRACEGVVKPRICRGAVEFCSDAVQVDLAELPQVGGPGQYWRNSPLAFSLLARCQGLRGSQKYTGIPVSP
jgi:hypothetical protein